MMYYVGFYGLVAALILCLVFFMLVSSIVKASVLPSEQPSKADGTGLDFTGPLDKSEVVNTLNKFFRQPEVISLSMQQGTFCLIRVGNSCAPATH